MVRRIFAGIVILLIVGVIAIYAVQRYHTDRMNSGEVVADVRGDAHEPKDTAEEDSTPLKRAPEPPRRTEPTVTSTIPAAMMQAPPATAMPASDSIAPNPPNGVSFSGTGRYTVYRQGNLTWRVNTDDGSSCIIFATMEEWRKRIVYSHGCGRS